MESFKIVPNLFLSERITGYFHQYYTGFRQPNNPDFLNILKNTFDTEKQSVLIGAREDVIDILMQDIPQIMSENNITNCLCVCVPRARALNTYVATQQMLKEAISIAANNIRGAVDGTELIRRVENTKTTHLRTAANIPNDGDAPYPGIAVATCEIYRNKLMNQNIILVDDIYTKNVNIDEDCIQALLNNGARSVIFYSIGYTRRV
ncbi:MAG TPA: hypothetical protein VJZ04_05765 [Lachnospiraceae bacterium]|nr:hypothetical protein [Lachnospiraceae bacterium]